MEPIFSGQAPAPIGPYSQGVSSGGFVFLSGQIPADPATGDIVQGGVAAQAEQVMANIKALLFAAGTSFDKVVKTTCFLADMKDFAQFNEVYAKHFTSAPARSCVAVAALPKGALVEVEVIAEAPPRARLL
jgi:2-iminobutanoate/2-iminopropanoate deaminase